MISLQKNIDDYVDRVNSNEHDIHRIAKMNKLKIKGLPYAADEKLNDIFNAIAQYVDFDLTNQNHLPELYRLQSKKSNTNVSNNSPTVIVKFIAKHIRDGFYSKYLAKVSTAPLKTEHINFPQGGRIIISENLTAFNQNIFVAAMKLKVDKKLAKVFTKDGQVMVKKTVESRPELIRSLRFLDLLMAGTVTFNEAQSVTNAIDQKSASNNSTQKATATTTTTATPSVNNTKQTSSGPNVSNTSNTNDSDASNVEMSGA